MSWKLALTLAANLFYVNAIIWMVEMIGRTFTPALHLAGSALVVALVYGALLVLARSPHPTLVAAGVPAALVVVWFLAAAGERGWRETFEAFPHIVTWSVALGGPLFALNRLLLGWVTRHGGAPRGASTVVGVGFLVTAAALAYLSWHEAAERKRADAAQAAWREEERVRIEGLRHAVAAGDTSKACAYFGSDPLAKPEMFDACRQRLEAISGVDARWKELAFLCQGSSFATWSEQDRGHDGGSLLRRTPVVPPPQQAWFVSFYFETWMRLDDHELLQASQNVSGSLYLLEEHRDVTWSSDVRPAVNALRPRLIDRLRTALAGSPTDGERAQGEWLLKTLESRPNAAP